MMKAQAPKFESCLFGPSCQPIPIDRNNAKDLGNNNISTPEKKDDQADLVVHVVSNANVNAAAGNDDDEKVHAQLNTETNDTTCSNSSAPNGGPKSDPLPVDVDVDAMIQDNAGTPPQTPLRVSRPLRPSKSHSSSKSKGSTKQTTSSNKTSSTSPNTKTNAQNKMPHTINLQELRRLSSQGVPDDCTLRPLAWRVLLGYLPLDTSKWQSALDRDRSLYRNLVNELFVASEEHPFDEEGGKLRGRGLNTDGRTLRLSPHNTPHKDAPARINEAVEALSKTNLLDKAEQKSADEQDAKKEGEELEIPTDVREQWRKTGRDPESLMAAMGGKRSKSSLLSRHFNALLLTNNDTASTRTNDEKAAEKADEALQLNGDVGKDLDHKWRHFLENASLLDEIRKDVERTHPDLQFFLEPRDHFGLRRYAAIERILFVWAKLNKGVRYVQGMNEIVGTMYFVLANDENEEWASEAEADTYFLFNTLMVEMRDIFVPDLDEADTGIQGRMANMLDLLSLHDPEVRCHLDDSGIDPGFYSIRWLTTFLSREFLLPDTIRLWDSMLASTHKDNFMRYVCVCMVMIIRESLLKSDFGACLKLLQAYPPTDVDKLLESSRALWIYESQVTLACHKGGISLNQALTTISPPPAVVMAYGLHGGLALDQIERMRQELMQATNSSKRNKGFRNAGKNLNNTTATAGKSFFGGFFNNKK